MRTVSYALALVVLSTGIAFAKPPTLPPVRIQVFTAADEGGFVDEESTRRTDSLKDILKFGNSKKKTMLLSADESAVTLQVMGRDWVPTGDSTIVRDPVFGGVKSEADHCRTLFAVLRCGEYSTEIVGRSCPMPPYGLSSWRGAAGYLIVNLEKWVKMNRDQPCLQ